MGMDADAIQAALCLPAENWSTCFLWQPAQVAGVGILAAFASSFDLWSEPWQAEQSMPFFPIFPSRCCFTTPGVTVWWHSTQALFLAAAEAGKPNNSTAKIAAAICSNFIVPPYHNVRDFYAVRILKKYDNYSRRSLELSCPEQRKSRDFS
jgi:hypothetical protein